MLRETWDERRHLTAWLGGTSGVVIHGLLAALLGIYVPWRLGLDFLDPLVVVPYWCTSLLFVAGAAGEAFTTPGAERLARLVAVLAAGVLYAAAVTGLALVTVSARHWHGQLLWPAGPVRWAAPLLSLSAAACMAATGRRLVRQGHTAQGVKSLFRGILWGVVLLLVAGPALAPGILREALAPYLTSTGIVRLCLAGAAALAAVTARQIRRR